MPRRFRRGNRLPFFRVRTQFTRKETLRDKCVRVVLIIVQRGAPSSIVTVSDFAFRVDYPRKILHDSRK